jgi:GNAT superfamily N-acetyltransferase
LSALLHATFPDPNTVLELDRMREFLNEDAHLPVRRFHVVVAEQNAAVVGGTIFSYVPRSNCGFSEYIVADRRARGIGVGRQLFDMRKNLLDQDAAENGQPRCHGLFIEADNPERAPAEFAEIERITALDNRERLRIFAHLGFRRVDLRYVQPPLGPGKDAIDYLDLLFAPWQPDSLARIPKQWILATLEAIWSAWSPTTYAPQLSTLREALTNPHVRLGPLGD